jgi:hypothetical protein
MEQEAFEVLTFLDFIWILLIAAHSFIGVICLLQLNPDKFLSRRLWAITPLLGPIASVFVLVASITELKMWRNLSSWVRNEKPPCPKIVMEFGSLEECCAIANWFIDKKHPALEQPLTLHSYSRPEKNTLFIKFK